MKKLAASTVLSVALLTGCAGGPAASPTATATVTATVTQTAAPTRTATPTPTRTPAPVKTSGNYGADLAAAGIIPDDVADYGQFMKKELCDSSLGKHKFWDRSVLSENIRTLASAEAKDLAMVRLSVAYFCPERAGLAEEALREHGYIK